MIPHFFWKAPLKILYLGATYSGNCVLLQGSVLLYHWWMHVVNNNITIQEKFLYVQCSLSMNRMFCCSINTVFFFISYRNLCTRVSENIHKINFLRLYQTDLWLSFCLYGFFLCVCLAISNLRVGYTYTCNQNDERKIHGSGIETVSTNSQLMISFYLGGGGTSNKK